MGCGCGCGDVDGRMDDRTLGAFDNAIYSVKDAMAVAWDLGFREGAKTMVDAAELTEDSSELEDLVEADAVALDSVLTQVQELSSRLEFVENQIGLKYTG